MAKKTIEVIMSFSHFCLGSVPVSTRIKEDLLASYQKLDSIKNGLKKYETSNEKEFYIKDVSKNLLHVIKIYNENIEYINCECANFKQFSFPTLKQYSDSEGRYGITAEKLQEEYNDRLQRDKFKYSMRLEEVVNLGQVGLLHPRLKQKIEKATANALKRGFPVEQLPELKKLNEFEAKQYLLFETTLRNPQESTPISSFSEQKPSSPATPGSSAPSTPSEQPASTTDAVLSRTSQSNGYLVTINYPLSSGSLGICYHPYWDSKPAVFTSDEHGWKAEIPYGVDYKYVIVEGGKVLKWEERYNRHLTEGSSDPASIVDQPRFA